MSISDLRTRVSQAAADANRKLRSETLGGKAARNAGWVTIGYGVEILTRFISSLILTRLLDPTAYGLISTVMVFVTIATMLSDLGIRPIILTDERGDEKQFLGMIWSIQVVRGFAISSVVALIALAWYVGQAEHWIDPTSSYANPLLPSLLLVTGLSMILRGLSSVNEYRVARHLDTRSVQRVAIGTKILTTIFTVAIAFAWPSVWALAIAVLIEQVFRSTGMALFVPGPRMSWQWVWREIRQVLNNSRWIALNSTMTVISGSADKLMIGYVFGLAVLGVYSASFTLYAAITVLVLTVVDSIGVPIMRALAEMTPGERKKAYLKLRLPIDLFCASAGLGMVLFAPLFFKLAYDPRYHEGGFYLAILGVKLILMPLSSVNHYLTANRRFKLIWGVSTVQTAILLSGMALAAWFHSIELAILAVALEKVPESLLYRLMPGTGVPRDLKRDGLLGLVAAGSLAWLLI